MSETPKLNPWQSIWTHPKKTMRYILDNYPTKLVHTLAIAGAFTRVVSFALNWYNWWMTIIIWISLSIFTGLFFLYIFGGLLKWTGNWLKGGASFQDIRAALAWSQIPVLAFFVIEMAVLAIVRGDGSSIFYATVVFILGIWSTIILLCCLAEAQQFSFFKSLINYIISAVVLIAVIAIVTIIVSVFSHNSPQTN